MNNAKSNLGVVDSGSHGTAPSRWRQALPDFVAFVIGLGIAYFLSWQTRDLVWSLWLSSLTIGYLTLLLMIGSDAYGAVRNAKLRGAGAWEIGFVAAGAGVGALMMVAFFSFHFGMFHFVHGVFLTSLFPPGGGPADIFGTGTPPTTGGPAEFLTTLRTEIVPRYWMFLLPALLAERRGLAAVWHKIRGVDAQKEEPEDDIQEREPRTKANAHQRRRQRSRRAKRGDGGVAFMSPYLNVVRMHLLIFFFIGANALRLENFLVYAVVYFVYFFPFRTFFPKAKQNSETKLL